MPAPHGFRFAADLLWRHNSGRLTVPVCFRVAARSRCRLSWAARAAVLAAAAASSARIHSRSAGLAAWYAMSCALALPAVMMAAPGLRNVAQCLRPGKFQKAMRHAARCCVLHRRRYATCSRKRRIRWIMVNVPETVLNAGSQTAPKTNPAHQSSAARSPLV